MELRSAPLSAFKGQLSAPFPSSRTHQGSEIPAGKGWGGEGTKSAHAPPFPSRILAEEGKSLRKEGAIFHLAGTVWSSLSCAVLGIAGLHKPAFSCETNECIHWNYTIPWKRKCSVDDLLYTTLTPKVLLVQYIPLLASPFHQGLLMWFI